MARIRQVAEGRSSYQSEASRKTVVSPASNPTTDAKFSRDRLREVYRFLERFGDRLGVHVEHGDIVDERAFFFDKGVNAYILRNGRKRAMEFKAEKYPPKNLIFELCANHQTEIPGWGLTLGAQELWHLMCGKEKPYAETHLVMILMAQDYCRWVLEHRQSFYQVPGPKHRDGHHSINLLIPLRTLRKWACAVAHRRGIASEAIIQEWDLHRLVNETQQLALPF